MSKIKGLDSNQFEQLQVPINILLNHGKNESESFNLGDLKHVSKKFDQLQEKESIVDRTKHNSKNESSRKYSTKLGKKNSNSNQENLKNDQKQKKSKRRMNDNSQTLQVIKDNMDAKKIQHNNKKGPKHLGISIKKKSKKQIEDTDLYRDILDEGNKNILDKDAMEVKRNKRQKLSLFTIIYLFLGIFAIMVGYFAYYIVFQSPEVLNSAYNRRHDVLAEQVVKGKIYSSNMEILAETLVNEDGKEYRNYPYGAMFAHVVGRERKGRTGLEETENITLLTSSISSFETMYNDFTGTKSIGDNLITTLDVNLQQVAYDALGDNRGAVVAMEPSTGKILAMVSKPAYDPSTIDKQWDELVQDEKGESTLINRATQGLYPPGSTFKLVTALAYMRDNPEYLNFEYQCKGSIEYKGMTIRCYNHNSHGKVSLLQAMAKSCNTSFAYIGQSLDMTKYRQVAESLLLNQDLPVPMASNKSKFELEVGKSGVKEAMQTAIGQGKTLITPMQNLMIVSAIANGGAMMKPYLIDRIVNGEGNLVKQNFPVIYSDVMTTSEAAFLSGLMNEVVQRGTGSKLKDLKVSVAGKTGSADTEGNKAHAWFVGFAPVENPKIAISIIVENKGTGSDYAVPVAEKLLKAYFAD